jgi:hypothetical protein
MARTLLGSTETVEPRVRSDNGAVPALRGKATSERWLVGALSLLSLLTVSPRAHAFSEPRTYFFDAKFGGGGGRWFTSSPAEGHGCAVCHTGGGTAKLQISGLPNDGYALGATYEISLAWPEFAARAQMLRATSPEPSSLGLIAELVSESGLGTGRLELIAEGARLPSEQCQNPPGPSAVELYFVRPGEPTDEDPQSSCDATALGQRCMFAVISCAAEQARFRWTTPLQSVGPIWFSAGFVTADAVSSTPDRDAVLEVASPMLPATSSAERYESTLEGGCRIARAPGGAGADSHAYWRAMALPLGVSLLRVGRRRRAAGRKDRA